MSAAALEARGFAQVRPNVWVRISSRDGMCSGSAVWFRDGATFVGGAKFPITDAVRIVAKLCAVIGTSPDEPKREQAKEVLSELLGSDLGRGTVGAMAIDDDLEVVIGGLVAGREQRVARRARRRERTQQRNDRMREAIHRLARRVARNKVLSKLREGYAKVLSGPAGKAAAGVVSTVLQAYGVPRQATRFALESHFARKADRARQGGWAGLVERGTKERGAFKKVLREEGRRFGRGLKEGAKGFIPTGELSSRLSTKLTSKLSPSVSGEEDDYVPGPFGTTYQMGACF